MKDNIFKIIVGFSSLFLISTTTLAQEYLGWNCRNDIEVMCSNRGCGVIQGDDFTPVDVRLLNDGSIDVCAYTGCWSGKGTVTKDGSFTIFIGKKFKFSSAPSDDKAEDISVVVDERDNVAVMKNSVFAQPLICKKLTIGKTAQEK